MVSHILALTWVSWPSTSGPTTSQLANTVPEKYTEPAEVNQDQEAMLWYANSLQGRYPPLETMLWTSSLYCVGLGHMAPAVPPLAKNNSGFPKLFPVFPSSRWRMILKHCVKQNTAVIWPEAETTHPANCYYTVHILENACFRHALPTLENTTTLAVFTKKEGKKVLDLLIY